ncbi:MAG: valine--tRNA ligase [Paracoccaceae bacterium]|nr:MAG: valine--tRNA ligase [Rhodobacteraceae bacterium MED-G07]|tara:strand:- start:1509 stop:4388 length:2880 start_codon:yes stop_codon:yes gene_type:complete
MALEKTFDAKSAEKRIYEKWEKENSFRAGANASREEAYSIMIPPPNVTGVLHIGHAFNNTLQDILIRWKRMQGYNTLWQPGTDHAGIATQMVVERELAKNPNNKSRQEMGRDEFLKNVWKWKKQSGDTIINQLKRLGASCDWERTAFTMSGAPGSPAADGGNFHDAVIKVFIEMYNKGLIYRGKRLVNWDPHFETAISDLEVENIETAGKMWHFKYPLQNDETYLHIERDVDGNIMKEETRDYISIATTRPETMLGDGAIAVNPKDQRYSSIIGKYCEIPVGPKKDRRWIPIISDEYPDPDFGSGAVKITGAHDFNDYQVAKRNSIPLYRLMDTKGRMRDDGLPYSEAASLAQNFSSCGEFTEAEIDTLNLVPEEFRGLDRFEARKLIVEHITHQGLAVKTIKKSQDGEKNEEIPFVEEKPVMQPFGDRSKVVIEPMLTDQWFVDTSKIVGPALDAVKSGKVKLIPDSEEKTYYHWLKNIEPWCISRQLWWGHQIPVWFDENGDQYCAENLQSAQELAGNGVRLTQDPDVLDTWFSSGLWPIGTLGWPEKTPALDEYFPTSTLITGQDILFFWVARMMMMQLAVVDKIPFSTVYLHGLVRDAKGKKMSKSTGNVVDPLDIIDEYGADALRFTNAAMASIGGVLKLDMQRIVGYRNFGTKLWNAARYAEMNGAQPSTGNLPNPKENLNKWIMGETSKVLNEVQISFENFRFNDAANSLYAFIWGKVCDWYVELSKPLFSSSNKNVITETQETMGWVIDQCLILLHPIMPFITEELWGSLGKRSSLLVHQNWPNYPTTDLVEPEADQEMNWVISLIENIRSARQQMHVPAGLKIPLIYQEMTVGAQKTFERNSIMIMKLARISDAERINNFPKGTVSVSASGAIFGLPLADVIDIEAEKSRLVKAEEKLTKEINSMEGRLNNPKFVNSAPPEVVNETRDNVVKRKEEQSQVTKALKRLEEL